MMDVTTPWGIATLATSETMVALHVSRDHPWRLGRRPAHGTIAVERGRGIFAGESWVPAWNAIYMRRADAPPSGRLGSADLTSGQQRVLRDEVLPWLRSAADELHVLARPARVRAELDAIDARLRELRDEVAALEARRDDVASRL